MNGHNVTLKLTTFVIRKRLNVDFYLSYQISLICSMLTVVLTPNGRNILKMNNRLKHCQLWSIFSVCISLTACVASTSEQIETFDDISLKQANGSVLFDYTFYWILPEQYAREGIYSSQSKRIKKREILLSQMGMRSTELRRVTVDSETKVRLEDMAVAKLANKLQVRGACPEGYLIETTLWRERSIKLLGQCQ